MRLLDVLWDALLQLDELSASTSSVLLLLAGLLSALSNIKSGAPFSYPYSSLFSLHLLLFLSFFCVYNNAILIYE